MKMCETIPMFILVFTGYLCNNMDVAAKNTSSSTTKVGLSPTSHDTGTHEPEKPYERDFSEGQLSTTLVAGISIFFVLLCILVVTGVWCAWKKSKRSSTEITSVPSGERGVSLKRISTHDN